MGLEGFILVSIFATVSSVISGFAEAERAKNRAEQQRRALEERSRGHLINSKSSQAEIPLIYGQVRVGLNHVYVGTTGDRNDYLHLVGVIGEGPIDGIVQVDGVDQIWIDGKLWTEYGSGNVHYEFFAGTADQSVCSTLHDVDINWTNPLRNTAYLYLRLMYDQNKFQGPPGEITVEVRGLEVYDPRTASTAWSDNPALAVRDMVIRSAQRGGMGIAPARLSDTSFGGTATYCETKGWTVAASIGQNQAVTDNIALLLAAFRGELIYSENLFKLRYRDLGYESSVMTLTEDDVVIQGGRTTLQIAEADVFDTPTALRCKFLNPEKRYQVDDHVLPDRDAVASEGYREDSVDLTAAGGQASVVKMANYLLERRRLNKEVAFQARSRCAALEPCDVVQFTHRKPGWSNKYFRVAAVRIGMDGSCALSLQEEYTSFYDDVYDLASHSWRDTTLPSPLAAVPTVRNVSDAEEVYNYRGRSWTRWKIDFDPPDPQVFPFWQHAEIWIRIGETGDWKFMTVATTDFQLDPVEEGRTYYCRMRSVSIFGTKEELEACASVSHTILGKTSLPSALVGLTAIASGDCVILMAEEITDPDVEGYEIRVGDTWAGGIYLTLMKSAKVRLPGFRPGTHTFWAAPRDNAGNYAETKRSAQVHVFYPANYADLDTWAWDFATGTHANTEHTTVEGEDGLKCSHGFENQGDDLVTNGGFGSDTAGWTASSASLASVSGGQSGNCLQVTASAADGAAYQDVTVVPGSSGKLEFYYRNTSGDVAGYRIYDQTNGADIVAATGLSDATSWSAKQAVDFTVPAGCTTVRIFLLGRNNGDVVFFDGVEAHRTARNLSGTWLSPEYDLLSVITARFWGDFRTLFEASSQTWAALPDTSTWADLDAATRRWYEMFAAAQAGLLQATLKYGDVSGNLANEIDFFQLSAPEIECRYVQVEITLTDPDAASHLNLKELNMTAAYWS